MPSSSPGHEPRKRVVIAGGGVAALEVALALRELAGPLVELELIAPEREFSYRPISVAEPFERGEVRTFELSSIAEDQGARYRRAALAGVRGPEREAVLTDGEEVSYDYLVVAAGARLVDALPGALTFRGRPDAQALRALLGQAERGELRRLAFAVPPDASWTLPIYELALMTAARLEDTATELTLVTPEDAPLAIFGTNASEIVADQLARAGVALRAKVSPRQVTAGALVLSDGDRIPADAVVALPRQEGPMLDGLPHDERGFIPVDGHCRVASAPGVYVAGDASAFPLKQGGLAAQQADAVAEHIAAALGAAVHARPFRPVLRGLLLTGSGPLYLRWEPGRAAAPAVAPAEAPFRRSPDRRARSQVASQALWWPPSKIAGRYLAPYLAALAHATRRTHEELADRQAVGQAGPRDDAAAEQHRAAVELALMLADSDAEWGDFAGALHSLQAAEALDGVLPPDYESKRRVWQRALAADS